MNKFCYFVEVYDAADTEAEQHRKRFAGGQPPVGGGTSEPRGRESGGTSDGASQQSVGGPSIAGHGEAGKVDIWKEISVEC